MNAVNLHDLTRKAAPQFDELFRKCYNLYLSYQKQYTIQDFRYSYFATFSELILWTVTQLENFSNHNPDSIIQRRFEKLTTSTKNQILFQFDTLNRQNFINSAIFISDDFLNSVVSKFTNKSSNYKINIDYITVNIFGNDYEKFKILYTPYLIRNALHNNGYHRLKTEFDLIIDNNQPYSFRNGKVINFAGWDNLFIMVNKYLEIIVELIESSQIKNITKIEHTHLTEQDTYISQSGN